MAKMYEGDTTIVIQFTLNENLTGIVNRVLIKYRKPNGIEGFWEATITDLVNGVVQYAIPNNTEGLDDTGFWTTWPYTYYTDGSVKPGDPYQFGVYKQGKTYIAFPYGRVSSAGVEEEMAQEAFEILYDNATSGLTATNVQDAVDEVDANVDALGAPNADEVPYDGAASGLVATDVQAAIDEVDGNIDVISALIGQTSTIIYVDIGRADSYTEDGTIHRPYKTIATAVAAAPVSSTIKVAAGTYTGNIVLPDNVNLIGMGIGKTIFSGTVGTGSAGNSALKDLTINNALTISNATAINNVAVDNLTVSADVKAYNLVANTATSNALTMTSGFVSLDGSALTSTDASAILQSGGTLVLDNCDVDNNHATNPTVSSTTSVIRILSTTLNNSGGGPAANLDNGATSVTPNVLSNVIHVGGISTGTAYTVQEGVEGGDPTGSNFSKRPATQIGYDNAVSGLAATEVQAALDELAAEYNVQLDNTVYVAKNGSDTPPATGAQLGSLANPYLTVQAAIDSITDASASKYYIVFVMSGVYQENLTFKPYVGVMGNSKEGTRIEPSTPGTHSGTFATGGRILIKDLSLGGASQNIVFTHPALAPGGTSIWMDNVTGGTMTVNFLGGGVDFVQVRNDCWFLGTFTVHSAALTSYNNTFMSDIVIDDVGVEHVDGYGSASTNTIKDCFGEDLLCSGNTWTEFYNNYHWGTLQADGALCTISFCLQSAPDNPANLIALNGATLQRTDSAYALAFDNTASGLAATEVQAALDEGFSSIKSGTGADPTYSPTNTPELFYRLDTNTLWIHNGTGWNSVTLT